MLFKALKHIINFIIIVITKRMPHRIDQIEKALKSIESTVNNPVTFHDNMKFEIAARLIHNCSLADLEYLESIIKMERTFTKPRLQPYLTF
jgi:hypothetical protein